MFFVPVLKLDKLKLDLTDGIRIISTASKKRDSCCSLLRRDFISRSIRSGKTFSHSGGK
jgi:hypothetical protein